MLAGGLGSAGGATGVDSAFGGILNRRRRKAESAAARQAATDAPAASFPKPPSVDKRQSLMSVSSHEPLPSLRDVDSTQDSLLELSNLLHDSSQSAQLDFPRPHVYDAAMHESELELRLTPEFAGLELGEARQSLTVLVTLSACDAGRRLNRASQQEANAGVVAELARRVANWSGIDMELAGRLCRHAPLRLGRGDELRPFHCYLFENLLVCVVELPAERRADPEKSLLVKGYIVLSHIKHIECEEESLTVHVDKADFSLFRILFACATECRTWLADIERLRQLQFRTADLLETPLVRAYQPVAYPDHAAMDLVYLVPVNDSVTAIDLACLRDTLCSSVSRFSRSDRFGLVVYGSCTGAEILVDLVGPDSLDRVFTTVSQLEHHSREVSSADLDTGLQLVRDMFDRFARSLSRQHVILLATCAPSRPIAPLRTVFHVFDYGDYDPAGLVDLVRTSRGTYTHIDSVVTLRSCLLGCLAGLASCQHARLSIVVDVPPRERGVIRLASGSDGTVASGSTATIEVSDLMAGQSRDFFVHLDVQPDARGPADAVEVLQARVLMHGETTTSRGAQTALVLHRNGVRCPSPALLLRRVEVSLFDALYRLARRRPAHRGLCMRALAAVRKTLHRAAKEISRHPRPVFQDIARHILALDEDVAGCGPCHVDDSPHALPMQALHIASALEGQRAWTIDPPLCRLYVERVRLISDVYDAVISTDAVESPTRPL